LLRWLAGVCAGLGELLAVADVVEVAPPDGAGEDVAVADAVGAAPGPGPAEEPVVAIITPATIATTPVMTPTASSSRVQEDAGSVPDAGPSPVNGLPLWGWTGTGGTPSGVQLLAAASRAVAAPGARVSSVPWANSPAGDLGHQRTERKVATS
jgi:hypothetical protein